MAFLHEVLEEIDGEDHGIIRDIKVCNASWKWFNDHIQNGTIKTSYFSTFHTNTNIKIQSCVIHSIKHLPHRHESRIGTLQQELIEISKTLGTSEFTMEFSEIILSYCGVTDKTFISELHTIDILKNNPPTE